MQFYNYNGVKVTTTDQLAELFQVEKKLINRNFQRNKSRYVEGVHFFLINGSTLKNFKSVMGNPDYLKFTSTLYLWTIPGVHLIAKSCRSEEAWEMYQINLDI